MMTRILAAAGLAAALVIPAALPAAAQTSQHPHHDRQVEGRQSGSPSQRIAVAFAHLGMRRDQSRCYGTVVTHNLGPKGQRYAARVVERAHTSADVRAGVKHGGLPVVQAFMAAQSACGS